MSPNGHEMDDDDDMGPSGGGMGMDDGDEDDMGIDDSQSLNAGANGEWTYEEQFKQVCRHLISITFL